MTHLTFELAATHDRWFREPAVKHAYAALKLVWKHFARQHSLMADALEWTGCGAIAVGILFATLIAHS